MTTMVVPLIVDGQDVLLHQDNPATTFVPNPGFPGVDGMQWLAQGATRAICKKAVDSCARAFLKWKHTSLEQRRSLFLSLASVLRNKEKELGSLIRAELQCSDGWVSINIADTIAMVEHVASLASSPIFSAQSPKTRDPDSLGVITQVPLGVIIGIAPWNAPAILGMRAVAAAVMAGNTTVLKGSELSPRTHHFIAASFRDAGFPPGVVNFLLHKPADAEEIFEELIAHPEVRKCNFTGSTAVGRQIAMRAAFYLKPVLLELGGKNYAVVLEDANLDSAADMILEGAFLNSGQICMSTDVVLVVKSVKEALTELLRAKLVAAAHRHVTRVISDRSEARIQALLDDAQAKGARLHTARTKNDANHPKEGWSGKGQNLVPTMIENINPSMRFWSEESFGPIIGIAECSSLGEAEAIIRGCQYGLSSAIFSRGGLRVIQHASNISTGAVHINGPTVHDEPALPHGGFRQSGWGRFGGHWALLEFTQTHTIICN